MKCNLEDKRTLKQYSQIMRELRKRKIVRSRNNPVADYAEKIVADKLKFKLASKSCKGYDAVDQNDIRYQIKGRQLLELKSSRQLGVIRNLDGNYFDYLIAIIFDSEFYVLEAWKIPRELIKNYARFNSHQNGHILILKGRILQDRGVKRIKGIEERKPKMNKRKEQLITTNQIKQGMVRPCGGKSGLFATFGIWPRKLGKWIWIYIAGNRSFNITAVNNNPNSVRYHKHLFERLKKLLVQYNRWPF